MGIGEALRHQHPLWAVGCRQEPAAITSREVRPPPVERAEVTGETSGRGAAAPPTAVLAEGDFPPREEVKDQVTIQMPAEAPTCRCCARRPPGSPPAWTSPSTR